MIHETGNILFIHNTYLNQGGEDTVIANEMNALRKTSYTIYYKEYSNASFQQSRMKKLLLPFNLFFNLSAFIEIFFFIKKHRISIVHIHNLFYYASPSVLWAAKLAGAKTVITIHNYRLFCLNAYFFREGKICYDCHTNRSFKKGIKEKCFKSSGLFSAALAGSTLFHRKLGSWQSKVDRFIVVNQISRQFLSDIHVPEDKIIFKPNFINNTPAYSDYTQREDFYLFAGRLSEEKGIRQLILDFSRLNQKLFIAGDGDLASFVREHVSENIIYLGHQNREQMQDLLLRTKALLFASIWIEGMPMTIIEAQAAGTIPIVAGSLNTEQMIRHDFDGYLYDPHQPGSLHNIITGFEAKTTEELNRISHNARNTFLARYQEKQHIEAITQIYEGLF